MPDIPDNLIDGVARAAAHPTTFEVPSPRLIASMGEGDYFKIGLTTPEGMGERFWVKVSEVETDGEGARYTGTIDNDLTLFDDRPCGSMISFRARHILGFIHGSRS